MAWIDLSLPISPELAPVPGHPRVTLTPLNTHQEHGRSNTYLCTSIHCGTHLDAPYHFDPAGATVDALPLERFVRPGVLAVLKGEVQASQTIGLGLIQERLPAPPPALAGTVVVLHSGWLEGAYYGGRYYQDNPHLSVEAARWLVEQGAAAVAVDFPVDRAEGPPRPGDMPVHRTLLSAGVLLYENLINLDQLPPQGFRLYAFPLKVQGGNGAPARIVAWVA